MVIKNSHGGENILRISLNKSKKVATSENIAISSIVCGCGCKLDFFHEKKPIANIFMIANSFVYEVPS